ncbi:MAG: isoprenylcysteine carboxylmethyltransferase family protein [Candidatus Sulfotelmatobacter sp.]
MRTPRLLTRWALITASIAALFFLSAGTLRIASLRNYLVAFSFLLLVTMLAVDPSLAQERANPQNAGIDDSRIATGLLFLLTLAVAGFSVGHCHRGFNAPPPIRHLALAAFLFSGAFQTWAMTVNPFFSPVVRIQTERGHHLVAEGPYRLMRHPGYCAMLIAVPASAIAIGSYIALLPACGFAAIIMWRVKVEDSFLLCNLPDYRRYANRVPRRLLPSLLSLRATGRRSIRFIGRS